MDKKTGKHSAEQELSLKVFEQSSLLQQMNKAYTSFHSLLQSKKPDLLQEWIDTHEDSSITNINLLSEV